MTFDWWPWIILGALGFFGAGWLFARIDIKQLLSESRALPQSYFKGLNFLLNEQQDKAIEAFIDVTRQNPEAVELQFALGSLFRRRGEVDRALRIHQSLSERVDLPAEQRTTALLELALDYQKSGLLDHAERILSDLAAKSAGNAQQQAHALRLLLDIYVQENDWQRAVEIARRLGAKPENGKRQFAMEMANYYCELAAESHGHDRKEEALRLLDDALAANPKCVRANLMHGQWLAAAGRHGEAIETWRKIEQQNPAYLGLMADQLLTSFEATGQAGAGLAELRAMHERYPALDVLNALFGATLKNDGPEAAYQLVKEDLKINPTLVGLDRLLEAQILAAPAERKQDLEMLKGLVHSHSSRLAVYLCAQCGFKAKQFYWHCPACGGWETFPPRRTAEYDTADRHLARLQAEG